MVCSTCSNLNALARISQAQSSMTGIWECRESAAEQVSSCQEEHRGCKQGGCDISTSWVTDVQLYKVAFMTRGRDLCEIWDSRAGVPLYKLKPRWTAPRSRARCERSSVSVAEIHLNMKKDSASLKKRKRNFLK